MLLVMAAVLALGSSGPEGGETGGEGAAGPPHPLVGTAWRAERIGDEATLDHHGSTLAFASAERVAGSGACNRFSGAVTLSGASIAFGPLASTRMACEPAVMDQEQRFFAALAAARGLRHDEESLELSDADGRVLVRLRRIGVPAEAVGVGEGD
jgi:putative lipoprotein